ncbi:phage tail tape measure protein [Acinetobacter sp. WCHAc060033]|uniref:phage tail tape measure protein n=1 Tax=Acinetobacter sp. WCHAc060033 TaxID=2518624 RepID=UPI001D17F04F|nr:phage tail tape measure protein [Acinetobacter sp. WCHAc060033]
MSSKKFNATISIGGEVSASLRTAIGSTTSQLGKIGSEIHRVKKQQSLLGESIRTFGGMGKDVDNLRARYSSVTTELTRLTEAQEKLNRIEKIRQKNNAIKSTASTVLGASVATAATMIVPVKLAIDYESAMADVKKVFNGTESQFKSINTEVLKMSTKLPMAAKDIASIVASGAQSGIASNELTKFAETAVKMGVAFDITAQESGQAMAEMRTAFKMSQDEVTELADKINYLGNNSPAAAKGIMEIVQRIGPLGEVGGFASGSIAALGATIRGMGVAEEIAATGVKNMMLALVSGESATKSQKAAFNELGMDSKKVAQSMQEDSEGTTLSVLKAVSKLEKYKQAAVLKELFGSESLGSIAPLLTNMEALEKNLNSVSQANKNAWNNSMQAEYEARANTTANKLQLLKNNVVGLGITIGTALLPVVSSVAESMSHVIGSITGWAQANPKLASTLTKIAVGVIAVVGGVAALALGATTILGPMALAVASFSALSGGAGTAAVLFAKLISPIKMVGTVLGIVGKAMLANPMVLAITAIVAVVAGAAYLIYKNWEPIKKFFSELWAGIATNIGTAWGGIKSTLSGAWDGIKSAFSVGFNFIKDAIKGLDSIFANNPILTFIMPIIGIPRLIISNWSAISSFFSQLLSTVSGYFSTKTTAIKDYFVSAFNAIHAVVSGVWGGITAVISTAFSMISNTISAGMSAIGSFMTSAWGVVKNIVATAWTGLCTLFLTITPLGYIVQNFEAIKVFLSGLATSFLSIGKNIIDGLIQGIMSGFEKLKSVWNSINSYMPDFMKKRMDIHSPSRVMAGLGGFIVDGIGVGMVNRTPVLEQQFGDVLNTFDKAPPTPALSFPNNIKPTPQGSSNRAAGSGASQNIIINIYPTAGQNAEQIADIVIKKMNKAGGVSRRNSMIDAGYSQ